MNEKRWKDTSEWEELARLPVRVAPMSKRFKDEPTDLRLVPRTNTWRTRATYERPNPNPNGRKEKLVSYTYKVTDLTCGRCGKQVIGCKLRVVFRRTVSGQTEERYEWRDAGKVHLYPEDIEPCRLLKQVLEGAKP